MAQLAAAPGTYALILSCTTGRALQIGRFGQLPMRPGFYVYIGSAFGPGGVRARIAHHLEPAARPYWHIDFLRTATDLAEVWYTYDLWRWEHQWAALVARMPGATLLLPGFGASDCTCAAHLYFFATRPSQRVFYGRVWHALRGPGVVHVHDVQS